MNKNFILNKSQNVPFVSCQALSRFENIVHGFGTRQGGTSTGCLTSMNLGFSRGDHNECVMENYRLISSAIGFNPEKLVSSKQTHTANIRKVTKADWGKGFHKDIDYNHIDGLITNVPETTLAVFYADCVPLLLFDPAKKAIGAAHSGWRGTVQKIGTLIVKEMEKEYGSNPKDIIAVIGPSICQDCYEVDTQVINQVTSVYPEEVHASLFYPTKPEKYQLNLWNCCKQNFLEAGIPEANIFISELCTCCEEELFFSHRRMGENRGNGGCFIGLK